MNLQRFVSIAILSTVSAGLVAAQPGKGGNPRPPPSLVDDVDRPTLSARVIEESLTPYLAGVRACYLGRVRSAHAGHLRLELIIGSNGAVAHIAIVAPGASATERRGLDGCLRAQLAKWHFPVRRGATSVIVPFYFVHTIAPGAGAQESCWSPRGCPDRGEKERP